LRGYDAGRLSSAASGFARSRFRADYRSPREILALIHARMNRAEQAWRYAEDNLARGLLEDLNRATDPLEISIRNQVSKLDESLLPLLGTTKLSEDQKRLREQLSRQRQDLLDLLTKRAAARSASLLLSRESIQKQIPPEAALVFWLAGKG